MLATLAGIAVPYDVWSELLPFRERFLPGAFGAWLASESPCHVVYTHEGHKALAMRSDSSLRLFDSPEGLRYQVDLPDTAQGADVLAMVERRELTGASIEFKAIAERCSNGLRDIVEAKLFGIALTNSPAYPTTIEIRTTTVLGINRVQAILAFARRRRLRMAQANLSAAGVAV